MKVEESVFCAIESRREISPRSRVLAQLREPLPRGWLEVSLRRGEIHFARIGKLLQVSVDDGAQGDPDAFRRLLRLVLRLPVHFNVDHGLHISVV